MRRGVARTSRLLNKVQIRNFYYVARSGGCGSSNSNANSNNNQSNNNSNVNVETRNNNNSSERGMTSTRGGNRRNNSLFDSAFSDFWSPPLVIENLPILHPFLQSGFGRDPFAHFDSFFNQVHAPAVSSSESSAAHWRPKIDVRETPKEVVVHAELPGLNKEDIKISVKDGVVTLSGERKFEEKKEEGDYSKVERSYGSFHRSFSVGDNIDPKSIKAKYNNGILELTVPKPEQKVDTEHNVNID